MRYHLVLPLAGGLTRLIVEIDRQWRSNYSYASSLTKVMKGLDMRVCLAIPLTVIFMLTISCSQPSKHDLLTQHKWKIVSSTEKDFQREPRGTFSFTPDGKFSAQLKGGQFFTPGNWHFEDNESKIVITQMVNWAVEGLKDERVIFNVIRLTSKNLDLNMDAVVNGTKRSYQISLEAE